MRRMRRKSQREKKIFFFLNSVFVNYFMLDFKFNPILTSLIPQKNNERISFDLFQKLLLL